MLTKAFWFRLQASRLKCQKLYSRQRDQVLKIELVNRNNPTHNEFEQHTDDPFFVRQAPSRLVEANNRNITRTKICFCDKAS